MDIKTKIAIGLTVVLGFVASAVAEDKIPDVWVGFYAGSHHGSGDYNETHQWKSVRASWEVNDSINAGMLLTDFKNSVSKNTSTIGAFAEYELYKENIGVGMSANYQLRKGYNIPILPIPYIYGQYNNFRLNLSYIPDMKGVTPSVFLYMLEYRFKF